MPKSNETRLIGDEAVSTSSTSPVALNPRTKRFIANLVASFQQAVVDTLVAKTLKATQIYSIPTIVISGGVAANSCLRDALVSIGHSYNTRLYMPSKRYCTDNAAMIACVGYFRAIKKAAVGSVNRPFQANAHLAL